MKRLTIAEAVAIVPVSESTLRRDIKAGRVSAEKDDKGHYRIDADSLTEAYGVSLDRHETPVDNGKLIDLLEVQVDDLKRQLEQSNMRETALIVALETAQQNASRMLTTSERPVGWFRRLLGVGTG